MSKVFLKKGYLCVMADEAVNPACKRAGFHFLKDYKLWATPFPSVVAKLTQNKNLISGLEAIALRNYAHSADAVSTFSVPVPSGLRYFPFQLAGVGEVVRRMLLYRSAFLFDEQGLGKTIQAAGFINHAGLRKILVVCPASLKINWSRELRKWLVGDHSIHVVNGNDINVGVDVLVINYDLLKRHAAKLAPVPYELVVYDEVHYLKNSKAQRTCAAFGTRGKGGAVNAERLLALSGTPIPNRPAELFTVLNKALPIGFPNKNNYLKRYCNLHIDSLGYWNDKGSSNLDELNLKLRSTLMIRRLKADVLKDLPAKTHQIIVLEPKGAGLEKAIRKERDLLAEFRGDVDKLRGSIDGDTPVATIKREIGEAKVKAAIAHLEDSITASGRVIAFCYHKSVAASLKKHFGDRSVVLTGSTTQVNRQAAVDKFQSGQVELFIGNIDAAGTGITLTASSHVVFIELSWESGKNEQAADRAHRIGQKDNVLIQYLVYDDSIDAYIAKAVKEKAEVIEQALDESFLL